MVWDGDSRGTFGNIRNLVAAKKPVVVYLSPGRSFSITAEVEALLSRGVALCRLSAA